LLSNKNFQECRTNVTKKLQYMSQRLQFDIDNPAIQANANAEILNG
jgi:hypothetical protein